MPERNIQVSDVKQEWRGVDQRSAPTLAPEGFCTMTKGVFFGLGNNAERIAGKKLSGNIGTPVFNIEQFGTIAFVQTLSDLRIVPITELTALTKTLV